MKRHQSNNSSSGNPGIKGLAWAMLLAIITVAVIFASAIEYGKLRGLPTPTGTDLVSILMSVTPTKNIVTAISTSTVSSATSSSTLTAIPTSTFTFPPSFTSTLTTTATINLMVFRGLDQQCLNPSFWSPYFYPGDSKEVDSRNCWNLDSWGIASTNSGLNFIVTDSITRQDITRRLYTKIQGDAEIMFTIRIDQLTANPNFDGILMLGVGDPDTPFLSGFYIKYTIPGKDNIVYRGVAPDIKTYYEPRSKYNLKESQNIIIRIKGNQVKIIADGVLLKAESLTPKELSAFLVIYSLPSNNGSLVAEVSNIEIYDQR